MNSNQFDPKAISSFLLWADNMLSRTGQAFTNFGSIFYPVRDNIYGYYTYGCPFKPLVADVSIQGATVMTGIYLNNNFITIGTSGLADINYGKGEVYFTGALPSNTVVSGNYAVKDLVTVITDNPDDVILFETKYEIRPKTYHKATGLPPESLTVPMMFVKNDGGENSLFSLDGLEASELYIRAVILADSQFLLDSVGSLFKDRVRTRIPLLELSEMPFNNLGGYKSGVPFDYSVFSTGKVAQNTSLFVEKVEFSKFTSRNKLASQLDAVNTSLYYGFLDFTVNMVRKIRF